MSIDLRPATVRVPCSTSNLGSGFDTLGLALARYLSATYEPGGGDLAVLYEGTLADLDVPPDDDILASAFGRGMAEGGSAPTGTIRVASDIPLARGLGSSAAALVAGYDLARASLGMPIDRERTFRFAAMHEGHGDNAAPATFGGFRAIVHGPDGPVPLTLQLSASVGFAYAAPSDGLSTGRAREALPTQVSHKTAVAGLGRLIALLHGLALPDPELIRIGIEDELHVPYRLPLVTHGAEARAAGYDAGAWGVTVSGSGSGLIALCAPEDAERVASAMRLVFSEGSHDPATLGLALRPDFQGVVRDD